MTEKESAAIWQPTFYFPRDTALLKALYLAKFEATQKANDNDSEPGTGLWGTEHHV